MSESPEPSVPDRSSTAGGSRADDSPLEDSHGDDHPDSGEVPESGIDLQTVVAEIEAEAQRRRESGEFPPELLEHLDEEFNRFAPLTFRRTGIDGAIRAVETAAFINVEAPTSSARRPVALVKTTIKKSTAWYHLHIARQVTALGVQMTRPLRMLNEELQSLTERVGRTERALGRATPALDRALAELTSPIPDPAVPAVVEALGEHRGRVAVGGAGEGRIVSELVAAGIDAYGLDGTTITDDVELRTEPMLDHLAACASDVLDAVVLGGVTDTMSNQDRALMVELATAAVRPGGRIVIVAADPSEWAGEVDPVTSDLSPGRPLHPDTWNHLLVVSGARPSAAFRPQGDTGPWLISASVR